MKRDMDLCRQLLFEIEATPVVHLWDSSESPLSKTHGLEIVNEHVDLLDQAGFISGYSATTQDCCASGLSWAGHDFVESIRSETVWNQAKGEVKSKGVGMTLDVLKAIVTAITLRALGLGPTPPR